MTELVLRALIISSLVLAIGVQPAIAARWYESYENAEEALAAENWPEAIRQINAALEDKTDSDARALTYGMNFVSYFPYYKLGIAYYNLGQLDAALQAFETEESLGAIVAAEKHYAQLRQFRDLIDQAKEDETAQQQQQIQQIVTDSLAQATRLEGEGRVEEALEALGDALAVSADDPRVENVQNRLLQQIADQQQQRELGNRVAQLVEEGRSQLASNRYQEAASTFSRALDLKDTAEVRTLLGESQDKLRAQIQTRDDAARGRLIDEALQKASDLQSAGRLVQALDQLQFVFALDPENSRALTLQGNLLDAQAQADRQSGLELQVGRLLGEVETHLEARNYREALVAANRVLAMDPGNNAARTYIADAYGKISRTLLGRNLRPIIDFFQDESRQVEQLGDGTTAELVSDPVLFVVGSVIDESTVNLVFAHGGGSIDPQTVRGRSVQGLHITDFIVRHRISSGFTFARRVMTTITATATDEEGAEETKDYTALYVVPYYRSLWLYSALAVVMAAVSGVWYGRRVHVRKQLLKRRFNPYIAGAPVMKDETFFGRERLMNRVLQTVHNNSILLYGERRIGKTSFQHRLKKRLTEMQDPEYKFYPVYIDLQGTPQEKFFATLAEDIFSELAPLLDGCKPDPKIAEPSSYDYRDLVRDLIKVIKVLKQKNDRQIKIVLLIDEVDELNAYDPRVNQRLRSLFMRNFSENLAAVVSGVAIKKHWESEGSPWYNFFEEIPVEAFRREDAVDLIQEPIKGVFKIGPRVVDRIIELTDCKPYLIQKLCIAVVNQLHEEGRRRITVADVEAVGRPEAV